MRSPRDITLKQLDEIGKDITAWCFECGRGSHVDTIVWQHFEKRFWPMGLDAAAQHFRCSSCGSCEHVRLYPAKRPYQGPLTGADMAAAIFFGARKAAKIERRDPVVERSVAKIVEGFALRNAPKRPKPPAPDLRLAWSKPNA